MERLINIVLLTSGLYH